MAHSSSLFTTYRIYDGQNGSECYFSEPQWLYKVCTISVSPSLPPSPSSSLHLTSLISVWRETWLQRGSHPPPWTLHPSVYLSVCLSVCLLSSLSSFSSLSSLTLCGASNNFCICCFFFCSPRLCCQPAHLQSWPHRERVIRNGLQTSSIKVRIFSPFIWYF